MTSNRNNNDCNSTRIDSDRDINMRSLLSSARMNSLLDEDESNISKTNTSTSTCSAAHVPSLYWQQRSNESGSGGSCSSLQNIHKSSSRDSIVFAGAGLKDSNEIETSPSSVGASVPDISQQIPFGSKSMTRGCTTRARTRAATAGVEKEEYKRDNYVRSGTHFRSLLNNALQKVAIGFSNANADAESELALTNEVGVGDGDVPIDVGQKRRSGRNDRESRPRRKRRLNGSAGNDDDEDEVQERMHSDNKYASELAREKVAEVMNLKRALKEAEDHSNAMTHANSALRDASATSSARLGTLTEALRIAGEKAANARADADATEARASSLATQLKSFKTVLNETKLTVESIRTEHDDISSASRDLERKLLQTESELSRVQKQKCQGEKENKAISNELHDLEQSEEMLKDAVEKKDDNLLKLKKTLAEREDIEIARQERTDRLENELRKARSMLVEMTSGAAEGESTMAALQETISTLQKENESLHKNIGQSVTSFSKERAKLQHALAAAENEAQKLRLKAATGDEEFQKLKLDKASSEKEVLQLKNRLSNLERRLAEVSAFGVVSPGDAISDVSSIKTDFTISSISSSYKTPGKKISSDLSTPSQDLFDIPKLKSVSPKRNTSSRSNISHRSKVGKRPIQNKCSICFKASYGIMKSCQCGNPACDKRAHASCISGKNPLPSVSHPGTPAPPLPAILCNTSTRRT